MRRRKQIAEINIVPYVDVMLVLLVIFMVTAPLLKEGVDVDVPKASAKALPSQDKPPLVVTVDSNGLMYLNIAKNPKKPMEPDLLQVRVAAELKRDPKRVVLVRGDKSATYEKVVRAMVFLQKAGASKISLETNSQEG